MDDNAYTKTILHDLATHRIAESVFVEMFFEDSDSEYVDDYYKAYDLSTQQEADEFVAEFFKLSLTHVVVGMTSSFNPDVSDKIDEISEYTFHLERSKDHATNITPEFIDALAKLAEQTVKVGNR